MREEILEDSDQMAMFIGRNRKARVTYGFDEIACRRDGKIGRLGGS